MKNFLIGLSKFVLGIILAMLIISLAGLSMARYFMTRMVEQPERPTYENDLPEDQRPTAKATDTEASTETETTAAEDQNPEAETESEETDTDSYAAYATTNLNVRSGPGTTYDSVGGVGIDENLTVIGEDSGWLNVQLNDGTEGWVSANYVTKE